MLNYIWFGLMVIALIIGAYNGTMGKVSEAAVESAKTAVEIAIGLVGVMTLWLGVMRIAEAGGLVTLLGQLLRPVLRWLFPEVPADHPANGAIVLSIAANMLGLSNAATPLGIKAMEELQTLNENKDTATDPMVTFMALNTSGVQLIPETMIGVLAPPERVSLCTVERSSIPRRSTRDEERRCGPTPSRHVSNVWDVQDLVQFADEQEIMSSWDMAAFVPQHPDVLQPEA